MMLRLYQQPGNISSRRITEVKQLGPRLALGWVDAVQCTYCSYKYCTVKGLQGRRVAGQEGCRAEGAAGQEGCRAEGLQGRRAAGQEGCRIFGIQVIIRARFPL